MYEGLGASVLTPGRARKFKFSFPYEPRAHKPTPGRAHTLPTSAGLSCSSFRMVSGELPGVRGGKGSPRVDYVDRYPSRGHFSSQNKFRVRVPKSKPEAVAPSPVHPTGPQPPDASENPRETRLAVPRERSSLA